MLCISGDSNSARFHEYSRGRDLSRLNPNSADRGIAKIRGLQDRYGFGEGVERRRWVRSEHWLCSLENKRFCNSNQL